MNIDDSHIKSCRLEEVDIPQNLDLLNKWTIPKVDKKLIYDYGWFDKLSVKQVVKTTEQSLALNPRCKLYDSSSETILVETNFVKSKITTRRPIKWDEINFPDKWILNNAVSQRQVAEEVTNSDYSHISQNPDGKVCIEFSDNSSVYNSPVYNRSFSGYKRLPEIQYISPISHEGPSYGTARRRPLSLHTLSDTVSEDMVERVRVNPKTNIVQAANKLADLDPTQSEMDFSVDKSTDLNEI